MNGTLWLVSALVIVLAATLAVLILRTANTKPPAAPARPPVHPLEAQAIDLRARRAAVRQVVSGVPAVDPYGPEDLQRSLVWRFALAAWLQQIEIDKADANKRA